VSALTAWCAGCGQEALVADDGTCVWCDGPTTPMRAKRGGGKPAGKYGRMSDDQLRAAHRLYAGEGLSCRQLGGLLFERFGYRSARSCGEGLYQGFERLGLACRSQREVTVARNLKHGRKRRDITREEERAYRRQLADERGWRAQQGPGQPRCAGTLTGGRGRAGAGCQRPAMDGCDFCVSHDPARALERQATLAAARDRLPRERLPLGPFAAWCEALYGELGSLAALGARLGCSISTAHNIVHRLRTLPGGGRERWVEIHRWRLERHLDGTGVTVADLYPELADERDGLAAAA